jgi:hypothetical protein
VLTGITGSRRRDPFGFDIFSTARRASGSMDDSLSDRWWNLVCSSQPIIVAFVAMNAVFLVLSAVSAPFVDEGSGSSFILRINVVLVLILLSISGFFLYRCRTR